MRNTARILLIILSMLAAIAAPAMIQGYSALGRAEAASAAGEYARAGAEFGIAARSLEWRPQLWEKAGIAYASSGDWERAMPLFRRAQDRSALSADGWDVFGIGYWLQSDNTQALAAWSAGLREYPSELRFYSRQALAYRGLAQYEAEKQALALWLPSGRATAAEHYRLGQLLMTAEPQRAQAELALASSMDESFDSAVLALQAALDLAARETRAGQRLVIIGRGLGLVEEWPLAQQAFEEATRADPQNAQAWAWLGEAREHNGLDGRGALNAALKLDPRDPVVYGLSGLGWKRQAQHALALADYLQAARLEPQNAEWQVAVGDVQGMSGNLIAALDAYQKATELAPDNAAYWRHLAAFCADNAIQVEEVGLPAAKKAAGLAPHDPTVLDALGWSYTQAGLLFNAEQNLVKATKLDPKMALAHLHLGEMYLRKGDQASARAELRIASELDTDGPVGSLASQLLKQYFP